MQGFTNKIAKKEVLYHLLGWTIFIAYEISFVSAITGIKKDTNIVSSYVLPYVINISLFYFHARVTLAILNRLSKIKWILFLPFVLLELGIYLLFMSTNIWGFSSTNDTLSEFIKHMDHINFVRQLWRGIYFLIFSTAYWYINQYYVNEIKLRETETRSYKQLEEKTKMQVQLISTENAYLQSQINPHLIFNTLNFMHNSIREESPRTAELIIILSDIMRYSLLNTRPDGKVELEKEIEQINNLIKINQVRFSHKLNLHLTIEAREMSNERLTPLMLIPFVENVFKYGELLDENNPAEIFIKLTQGVLYFESHNKIRRNVHFHSPGIGIENVKKRLQAYYPGKFLLNITDDAIKYSVILSINLNTTI